MTERFERTHERRNAGVPVYQVYHIYIRRQIYGLITACCLHRSIGRHLPLYERKKQSLHTVSCAAAPFIVVMRLIATSLAAAAPCSTLISTPTCGKQSPHTRARHNAGVVKIALYMVGAEWCVLRA